MDRSTAQRVSEGLFRVGRKALDRVPARIREALDQRLFYAIFHASRVTNDNYPGAGTGDSPSVPQAGASHHGPAHR